MRDVDLLLDLFERQVSWFHRDLPQMPEAVWTWRPDPEANSIALTMWHLARIMDWLMTHALADLPVTAERWHSEGWAARTGYDPTGLGWEKMGILSGYSQAEVAEVPLLSTADMLAYFDQSYHLFKQYVADLPPNGLDTLAPGMGGERTVYFWCQLSLVDLLQHWGEILAIKAAWERRFL